jgi:hypothetical protein
MKNTDLEVLRSTDREKEDDYGCASFGGKQQCVVWFWWEKWGD